MTGISCWNYNPVMRRLNERDRCLATSELRPRDLPSLFQKTPHTPPLGHRKGGLPCPTPQRPERSPLWPRAGPVRTDRRPETAPYAATAFRSTVSTTGESCGVATGIPRWIMIDALFAASCRLLVDRWA